MRAVGRGGAAVRAIRACATSRSWSGRTRSASTNGTRRRPWRRWRARASRCGARTRWIAESRADYFDSLYHAAAVVGLNTSALVEAAIVDRPVFTMLLPEFRENQEGTFHFHHLLTVGDGFLNVARSLDEHVAQLAARARRARRCAPIARSSSTSSGRAAWASRPRRSFVDAVEHEVVARAAGAAAGAGRGCWRCVRWCTLWCWPVACPSSSASTGTRQAAGARRQRRGHRRQGRAAPREAARQARARHAQGGPAGGRAHQDRDQAGARGHGRRSAPNDAIDHDVRSSRARRAGHRPVPRDRRGGAVARRQPGPGARLHRRDRRRRRRRGEVPDAHRRGREHAGRAVSRGVQPAGRDPLRLLEADGVHRGRSGGAWRSTAASAACSSSRRRSRSRPSTCWSASGSRCGRSPRARCRTRGCSTACSRRGAPVLLSTGMSPLAETDAAVARVKARGRAGRRAAVHDRLSVPAGAGRPQPDPVLPRALRLLGRAVGSLRHDLSRPRGVALGMDVLEVHVALSREMFGPDVVASVTTAELRQLVDGVRFIERMRAQPGRQGRIGRARPRRCAACSRAASSCAQPLPAGHGARSASTWRSRSRAPACRPTGWPRWSAGGCCAASPPITC